MSESVQRLRVVVRGAVQGVGFRPFVYQLATECGVTGWVKNVAQGVMIEGEATPEHLREFLKRLHTDKPARVSIQSLESSFLDPVGFTTFVVLPGDDAGAKTAFILPDVATCPDCLHDIRDPQNRRYRYPFTNCTTCGPRFSLIEALPYDRQHTTMHGFTMCPACQTEYDNPSDRRFHAQPNACPLCGPQLALWNQTGAVLATGDEALMHAADAIRCGEIVAVKGLGGFHLLVDARDEAAVRRLRQRKGRETKPLGLMFPSLADVAMECVVSEAEARLLEAPEAPIVLLRRDSDDPSLTTIAPSVAPGNSYLGVMLPYTPLHHLLLDELGFPVVATSGNRSEEPICIDECEALQQLRGIADLFLVHDRPIAQPVDDSVARVVCRREQILRRARGYAPLPFHIGDQQSSAPVLAVGAHQKNTVAMLQNGEVFISQHIGDLESAATFAAFVNVIDNFADMYAFQPAVLACDANPDYMSTYFVEGMARATGLPLVCVQHHYAHVLACMADNDLHGRALGVAWDGTGYGLDGTIWGGEFLRVTEDGLERVAHMRPFRLPGGDQAVKEPRRAALGLLYEIYGNALFEKSHLSLLHAFSLQERRVLQIMLERHLNAPMTTSAGRLFDAVAAITGLRQLVQFDGQAAMELEFALDDHADARAYPFALREQDQVLIIDWEPMLRAIVADVQRQAPIGWIAEQFHAALVEMIVAVAQRIGDERVVLTGGCFQNMYLIEHAVQRLRAEGFRPYWHQRVPTNDGGIALGQAVAAASWRAT